MSMLPRGAAAARAEAKVAAAGRLIANGTPESWLLRGLSEAAQVIKCSMRSDAGTPTREALRDRAQKLHAAAERILAELNDPIMRGWLSRSVGTNPFDVARAKSVLEDWLLPRAALICKDLPRGHNRHPVYANPGAATPQELCAVYIVVAWREARGTAAPITSAAAREACECLWKAAGASTVRWGQTPAAWTPHLRAAGGPSRKQLRAKLQEYFKRLCSGL
jgi:hypothetical protein